jgi:hypothetical protein
MNDIASIRRPYGDTAHSALAEPTCPARAVDAKGQRSVAEETSVPPNAGSAAKEPALENAGLICSPLPKLETNDRKLLAAAEQMPRTILSDRKPISAIAASATPSGPIIDDQTELRRWLAVGL